MVSEPNRMRVELSFDLTDTDQAAVARMLSNLGRGKKVAVVTEAIIAAEKRKTEPEFYAPTRIVQNFDVDEVVREVMRRLADKLDDITQQVEQQVDDRVEFVLAAKYGKTPATVPQKDVVPIEEFRTEPVAVPVQTAYPAGKEEPDDKDLDSFMELAKAFNTGAFQM